MHERWKRTTRTNNRLSYRDGPSPLLAAALILFSMAGIVGTSAKLVSEWPNDRWAYGMGIFVCLVLVGVGLRLSFSRQVTFEKSPPTVTVSIRLLHLTRASTAELTRHGEVVCSPQLDERYFAVGFSEQPEPIYFVSLLNDDPDSPGMALCPSIDKDAAVAVAKEVAAFLNWEYLDYGRPAA